MYYYDLSRSNFSAKKKDIAGDEQSLCTVRYLYHSAFYDNYLPHTTRMLNYSSVAHVHVCAFSPRPQFCGPALFLDND